MDPILEEMARTRGPADIKDSRFRDWVQYLCALFAAKEDEIAQLRAQIDAYEGQPEQFSAEMRRGPGRPRTCRACGQPETRHAETCAAASVAVQHG